MATNETVRRVVFDALDLPGVHRYPYPPESVQVPAAIVAGLEIDRTTFDGARTVGVTVLIVASHSDASQVAVLDELLDPTGERSALAALEVVSDVDGVSLAWNSVSGYGEVMWGGVSYYGAAITLTAFT
jgi:Zn-dependent alcohol dehydrogenase